MARGGLARTGAAGVTATRRAAALTVLAVVAGLALPVLAAGLVAVDDPDDTAGKLDVHEVRFNHLSGTPPMWTVITFDDWTTRQIWDQGYVLLFLDTMHSPDPDYFVLLRADRYRLVGALWRRAAHEQAVARAALGGRLPPLGWRHGDGGLPSPGSAATSRRRRTRTCSRFAGTPRSPTECRRPGPGCPTDRTCAGR